MSTDDDHRKPVAHILVVEDEFFIALEIKAVLIKSGFEVLGPVGSVEDALTLLHLERPDAAVLDLTLSDGKATPVAALLRSRGVPFLLASAETGEITESGFFQGVVNLGKPTDMRRLVGQLRYLLDASAP